MAYQPATRNRAEIQFASLRETFDPKWEAVHDALSEAYYDFWRHGQSHPVTIGALILDIVNGVPQITRNGNTRTFPNVTVAEAWARLQELLTKYYELKFHQANLALPPGRRIPVAEYDTDSDDGQSRAAKAQQRIDQLALLGFELEIPGT